MEINLGRNFFNGRDRKVTYLFSKNWQEIMTLFKIWKIVEIENVSK